MSFFYDTSQLGDDEDHDGKSELRRYFSQESAKIYESINGYYRRKEATFPIIFRMARDYLSMMAMSFPSDSLFSQVKSIVVDKRNRLQPMTIKMLAILKARGIIRDDASVYINSGQYLDEATNNSHQDHTKILDTIFEKHSSGVTELISANIVNLKDVDYGKNRKRSEASSSTGLREMKDIGACGSQNSGNMSEAESLDTTHDSAEYSVRELSDAETFYSRHNLDVSDAKVSDAETLNSSNSLELIDMESIDSRFKKVSQSNIDLRCISDSGEDEEGKEVD